MNADMIPMIVFQNTPSVHLLLYTEGILDNWRQSGQPEYAKNEEWFASF